jgi:hypothetical protein
MRNQNIEILPAKETTFGGGKHCVMQLHLPHTPDAGLPLRYEPHKVAVTAGSVSCMIFFAMFCAWG